MANPVTSHEIQQFSLDEDVGKLMTNFFDLVQHGTYGVVHTHHIQSQTIDIGTVTAGTTKGLGTITWVEPFPPGVVPIVQCTLNDNDDPPAAQSVRLTIIAYAINNTGCKINVFLPAGTDVSAGAYVAVTAIDPTYDVSGV